ncbi:hypothetical protein SDC9_189063 [bioreactor metagenome]|uniref:Uncharacterized protein n=1 Tax=bioreactor metagenome TaxID=1076179 RepID=A0A645HR28_9ZZZZ
MMRPRIGNAVIENAVAMNNPAVSGSTPSGSRGVASQPRPKPKPKGSSSPAPATQATVRRCLRSFRWPKSNSRPIWNISSNRPICDRICIGSGGALRNTRSNRSGASQPNSEGPSRMPVMISPTAEDCPRRTAISPPARAARMMMASCSKVKNSSASV